ncbi:hypothetical protein [Thermococcus sp.]|uniref:hypothetical protein n=1 Tax=Thermococcus sp. TaxID=35749 RepID=UPI0025DFB5B4|nr:hypothetical protein [Thermococcus sp.]
MVGVRKLVPILAFLILSKLAGASVLLSVPANGTVTYPWPVAGVGTGGGFIVAVPFNVTSEGTPPSPGAWVLAFGENGSLLWVKSVKGAFLYPSPEIQHATANGSIVLVGRSDSGNHTDLWVIQLNDHGELLWSKDYNLNIGGGWITFVDDVSLAGNETIIATHVERYSNGTYSSSPLLVVLDGKGRVLWGREYHSVHGSKELYSVSVGKLSDGYYLVLHDGRGGYYYLSLDNNGRVNGTFRFKTNLKGFFVKSATSTERVLYFLGGSSNGTLLGAVLNGKLLWSKLYTLVPERKCHGDYQDASVVGVALYSTEPSDSLAFSGGYLYFQPAVSMEFNLTCGELGRVYAIIKTDGLGNVLGRFVAVENVSGFGAFLEPKGLAVKGDSFIALWSLSQTNGSFVKFRSVALISEFGKRPEGSLRVYPFRVTTKPVNVALLPDGKFESRAVTVNATEVPLKVEGTGKPPTLAVETLRDSSKAEICGSGLIVLIALLAPFIIIGVKDL